MGLVIIRRAIDPFEGYVITFHSELLSTSRLLGLVSETRYEPVIFFLRGVCPLPLRASLLISGREGNKSELYLEG